MKEGLVEYDVWWCWWCVAGLSICVAAPVVAAFEANRRIAYTELLDPSARRQDVCSLFFDRTLTFASIALHFTTNRSSAYRCLADITIIRIVRTRSPLLLRSLTIPFNAIFSVVILGSVVSTRTVLCLVVIITGFIVGCGGEVKLSILGVQWGLISSVAVSLNSIYTKKVQC